MSQGIVTYQVFGAGIPNPYRLRPFLGARVPVNTSYSPVISMHNPHSSTLQVVEMYTSDGDLHLELPSGENKGLKHLWEIPPYQTKAVMRANFVGRVVNNHTAFIRIKTNVEKDRKTEMLILPMEIEVTEGWLPCFICLLISSIAGGGLFSYLDTFDFGTLRTIDEPKTLQLQLLNTGSHTVYVKELRAEPPNEALEVHFEPVQLTSTPKPFNVARIVYDPSKANPRRQQNGRIIAFTTDKKRPQLEFPYQATVLHGGLYATVSRTAFLLKPPPFVPVKQNIELTNSFGFPLTIYNAEFPPNMRPFFQVVDFHKPKVLYPGVTASPVSVNFTANSSDHELTTILRLFTNASAFTVPIHAYDGKLKYLVDGPSEDVLDFGPLGTSEPQEMFFRVINKNPVEVVIFNFSCNLKFIDTTFLGVKPSAQDNRGVPGLNRGKLPSKSKSHNISVPPGHSAVFQVRLVPPKKDESHDSSVIIRAQNTIVRIPLHFKTIFGVVEAIPNKIKFKMCFPGRIEAKSLFLQSSYSKVLKVTSIEPKPPDNRFSFIPQNKSNILLKPNSKIKVGWLQCDPLLGKKEPYLGLTAKKMSSPDKWLSRLAFDSHVSLADSRDHEILYQLWEDLKQKMIETEFQVNVDFGVGTSVSAQASLVWPSIAPEDPIKFPLTHIGNSSTHRMRVENPSDMPLVVQVLMLSSYPNPESALDLLSERIGDSHIMNVDDRDVFQVVGTKIIQSSGLIPPSSYVLPRHEELDVQVSEAAKTLLLKPRSHVYVDLSFSPKSPKTETMLVLLRNNLTIMDAAIIQGQGVLSLFTLDGREPGKSSHSPLKFNLTAVFLAKCNDSGSNNFTMKRTFVAKNSGQLPVHVVGMEISGQPCQGYGFVIRNCEPFVLQPNKTKKIGIDFTPDFTLSRIQRELRIITTEGLRLEFLVIAVLPHHLLSVYLATTPRPDWEPLVIRTLFYTILALIISVFYSAYRSGIWYVRQMTPFSDKTINEKLAQSGAPSMGKKFDLREMEKRGSAASAAEEEVFETPTAVIERPVVVAGEKTIEEVVKKKDMGDEKDEQEEATNKSSDREGKNADTVVEESPALCEEKVEEKAVPVVEKPPPTPLDDLSRKDVSRLKRKPRPAKTDALESLPVRKEKKTDNEADSTKKTTARSRFPTLPNGDETPKSNVLPSLKRTPVKKSDREKTDAVDSDLLEDDSIVKVIKSPVVDWTTSKPPDDIPEASQIKKEESKKGKLPKAASSQPEFKTAKARASRSPSKIAPVRDPHSIANTIAASLTSSKRARASAPGDEADRETSSSSSSPGFERMKDGWNVGVTAKTGGRATEVKARKSKSPTKQPRSVATTALKKKDERRQRKTEKGTTEQTGKQSIEVFQRFLANQKPEFKPRSRIESEAKESSSSENGSVSSPTDSDVQSNFPLPPPPPTTSNKAPSPPPRKSNSFDPKARLLDDASFFRDPDLEAAIDPRSLAFPGDPPAMLSFLSQKSGGGGGGGGGGATFGDRLESPSPTFDPLSGFPFDPVDRNALLSRMYLRRQASAQDPFLDVDDDLLPPLRDNAHRRSPSPLEDADDLPLFHHGSRVFPRRMRNTIWAQRVGRSGRGLVSRPLPGDEDHFDAFPFDSGRRYRSRTGFDWPPGPDDDQWDFDGGWNDRFPLDDRFDFPRRSFGRRVRDPDDVFSSGRRRSSPPPMLSEYYQRAMMAGFGSGSGQGRHVDREAWNAALQRQRQRRDRDASRPVGFGGLRRGETFPGAGQTFSGPQDTDTSLPFWDASMLHADSAQENWESIWNAPLLTEQTDGGNSAAPIGAVGDEMPSPSAASDEKKKTPVSPSDEATPSDETGGALPPATSTYDPFGNTTIWGPSLGTGGPWVKPIRRDNAE
eukprot:m.142894 g.142894  ORF g.142894 m.142894 type:complete len:1873 (+) comp38370_c0_seq35:509-6127(+)